MRVRMRVVLQRFSLLGIGRKLDLFHEVAYLLDFLIKLRGLLLGLLLKRSDLVIGLVSVLIGVIGLLDDIRHLLALLVQLRFQLLVQIVKDNPLLSQRIDQQLQLLIDSDSLIEFLVRFVEPILQYLDLLLEIGLALCS